MKFLAVVAAALVTTAAMTPAPASAAPRHGNRWKTVCKVQHRHGHNVRVCRKVRW
jgi:invasion protein IalB